METEILNRLSAVIGQPVHQALRDLDSRPIRHKQVTTAQNMPQVVCDLLEV